MAKLDTTFLVFSLDKDHVYRMQSTDCGFAYSTNGEVTFYAIEDPHRKATYQMGHAQSPQRGRLNRSQAIRSSS